MIFLLMPAIVSALVTFVFWTVMRSYRERKKKLDEIPKAQNEIFESYKKMYAHEPKQWSITSYFDRIAKVSEGIQKGAEGQESYILTLWWGIDGLKLNEDGTTEWIRKGEKKYNAGGVAGAGEPIVYQLEIQESDLMAELQSKKLAAQIYEAQQKQFLAMIQAIQPMPAPCYTARDMTGRIIREPVAYTGTGW